jgi:Terminase large subunit, T4likevirus-type, N-terminal
MNTDILQAIRDPQLLGNAFKPRGRFKRDTWAAWRSFYSAALGLEFENAKAFELFQRCTGRTAKPVKPFEEIICVCGRRSGKSHAVAGLAAFLSTCRDYSQYLSPGERGVCAIIAADKAQASILMGYIRSFISSSPALKRLIANETKESIALSNGVDIEIFAADAGGVRGRTLIACLVDEGVFVSDMQEIVRALRPALVTIPGAPLVIISSPWRKSGYVYSQYEKHFAQDSSDVLVWRAPSRLMNPTLSATRILAALATDRTAAKTEFLGAWRDDLSSFLTEAAVDACVARGVKIRGRVEGVRYQAFCDAAGGTGADAFSFAIGHLQQDGKATLDVLVEREPPFNPEVVVEEYVQLLRHFKITEIHGDRYAAGFCSTQFEKRGVSYRPSEKNRSQLYLELLPLVTSQRVELLDDPKLRQQLLGLERKTGRLADIVDHAPGQHDDLSNTTAGCLTLIAGDNARLGFLELVSDVASGRRQDIFAPPTPEKVQEVKERQLAAQARFHGMGKPRPEKNDWVEQRPDACPKCSDSLTAWVGQSARCQSCGHQWFPRGFTVVMCGRSGPFSKTIS